MHNILCEPMSDGNVEPVRPLPARVARVAGATRKRGASGGGGVGRPEWRDRRPVPGVSSLTRAAAVSQAVQGHAMNGDDAVRALPRERRALVALRW